MFSLPVKEKTNTCIHNVVLCNVSRKGPSQEKRKNNSQALAISHDPENCL